MNVIYHVLLVKHYVRDFVTTNYLKPLLYSHRYTKICFKVVQNLLVQTG